MLWKVSSLLLEVPASFGSGIQYRVSVIDQLLTLALVFGRSSKP